MMENTKSMLIHAWIAVLVQVLAQQVLSARNNSLILRRTIIRGHRVCGVFFFVVRCRLKVSGKEGSIQALILFCCAKRSISPSKAETSAKRSRSFYGRNSTAQKTTKSTLAYSLLFPLVFYQAGFFILRGCINKNKASLFYVVKSFSCFRLFVKYPSVYSFGRTDSFS